MAAQSFKMITCILNKGQVAGLAQDLFTRGVTMLDFYHARGSNIGDRLERNRLPHQVEKEVLVCLTTESESEAVFQYIYETAKISEPGGGFIFMGPVLQSSEFQLPKAQ